MTSKFGQHFEAIKWGAEFIMLPLHWMAVAHMYNMATAIGAMVMVSYAIASIHHVRATGFHGLESSTPTRGQ